jgi:uncharacterized membrane protein YcaP (DUF421 family)
LRRCPLDEVLEAARQQGVDDLAKIRLAVLEVSGRISIIPIEQPDGLEVVGGMCAPTASTAVLVLLLRVRVG